MKYSSVISVVFFSLAYAAFAEPSLPIRFVDLLAPKYQNQPAKTLDLASCAVTGAANVETTGDGLKITPGSAKTRLEIKTTVSTSQYNALRVTMRVTAGNRCRSLWETEFEKLEKNAGIDAPIVTDDKFHQYVLVLNQKMEYWSGTVSKLVFEPSDTPAQAEIKSLELVALPPVLQPRMDLNGLSLPILVQSQEPVTVTVPPAAKLVAQFGMPPRAWKDYATGGARFSIAARLADATEVVLTDVEVTPATNKAHRKWLLAECDLARYAGQNVQFLLKVNPINVAAGCFACWGNPAIMANASGSGAIPVVIVSCDTLRADRLSCYGNQRKTSPVLDQFAAESVVFQHAVVQDCWTLPSHISIMTGLYPKNHGVSQMANLSPEDKTLPELLRRQGYTSLGFTGAAWWFEPWRGLSRGFDAYDTAMPYRPMQNTVDTVAGCLDEWLGDPRLFLFVHNYDVHGKSAKIGYKLPYTPDDPRFLTFSKEFNPAPAMSRPEFPDCVATDFLAKINEKKISLSEQEHSYAIALYDDAILQMDAAIGKLFEELKKRKLYEQALIIIIGDHGEAFGEHGLYLHEEAYESCSRVPLIIRFPNGRFAGKRVAHVVQSVDIVPTIADVVKMPIDFPADGQSLLALLEDRAQPRKWAYTRRHECDAVLTDEWKLLRDAHSKAEEFYNLANDHGESKNLAGENTSEIQAFRDELNAFYAPDITGWHLKFTNTDAAAKMSITLQTNDAFQAAETTPPTGAGAIRILSNGNVIAGDLQLKPRESRELVVRTVGAAATIMFLIKSEKPVAALTKETGPIEGSKLKITLDPAKANFAAPPENSQISLPTVVAWHVPQKQKGDAAQKLTEEQKKELEALGYLK